MIEALLYFPISILIFFIYFLPGFLITRFLKQFGKLERFVLGFVFSTLIFLIIGLVIHILGFDWNLFTLLIPVVALILILLVIKKEVKISKEVGFLLTIFFIQYVIKLLILINVEMFPLGGDWISHYNIAETFLEKEWSLPTNRTFLYNFILGFFISIFQGEYWCAQITNVLISSLILLPTYLIGLRFFNKKIAILSFVLLSISPYVHWILYTWPKCFAGFLILVVFYFVMKRRLNVFVGISAGLAFLIHQMSLLYLIPIGLFILHKRKEFNLNRQILFLVLIPFIVAFVSWYGYNFFVRGVMVPTVFKYYPIAVGGYETLHEKTSEQIWKEFLETPLHKIFLIRAVNAMTTITPLICIIIKTVSLFYPITLQLYKSVNFTQMPWSYHHIQTIPGQVSLLLYIFVIIGFLKLLKDRSKKKDIPYLTIGVFLLTLFIYSWIVMITADVILPLIPLLVLIGFWGVEKSKNKNKWILLIFLLAIMESLIFLYWFGFNIEFTKRIAIQTGDIEYNKLMSVYKIFRK